MGGGMSGLYHDLPTAADYAWDEARRNKSELEELRAELAELRAAIGLPPKEKPAPAKRASIADALKVIYPSGFESGLDDV
jgi:hypothetical protein